MEIEVASAADHLSKTSPEVLDVVEPMEPQAFIQMLDAHVMAHPEDVLIRAMRDSLKIG